MVGVPGKYKGCNTCRARRVKCDNERPLCRKCSESGRECQGYGRETVFIVGTVEDKGRCSSHPPRNNKSPKNTPSPPPRTTSEDSAVHLVAAPALRSAWEDVIIISMSGKDQHLRIVALHTPLNATLRQFSESSRENKISLPPYTPAESQSRFGNEDFWLSSQCLAQVSPSQEGILLYLYEHNTSLAYTGSGSWRDPMMQYNRVRELAPGTFATFPAHHFFVRVYRPAAIVVALLDRTPTFCGEVEWISTPWDFHPKAPFDCLLDIISQIPSLFQRLDQVLSLEPTVNRRIVAQDLLEVCLGIQGALEQWHTTMHQTTYNTQQAYWISPGQQNAQTPFTGALCFQDQLTSITFLYYWATNILFYPCIGLLSHAIFTPVTDAYTQAQIYPELPPHLNIDYEAYGPSSRRDLAVNVGRGLDAALALSTQPDLLSFPVHVLESLYGALDVAAQTGEGALELMWLARFRTRMMAKGQDLAGAMTGRGFEDLAEW